MTVIMSKLEALLNDLKEVALGSFEEQVSWLELIFAEFRCLGVLLQLGNIASESFSLRDWDEWNT